jgi:hypothetical protein
MLTRLSADLTRRDRGAEVSPIVGLRTIESSVEPKGVDAPKEMAVTRAVTVAGARRSDGGPGNVGAQLASWYLSGGGDLVGTVR